MEKWCCGRTMETELTRPIQTAYPLKDRYHLGKAYSAELSALQQRLRVGQVSVTTLSCIVNNSIILSPKLYHNNLVARVEVLRSHQSARRARDTALARTLLNRCMKTCTAACKIAHASCPRRTRLQLHMYCPGLHSVIQFDASPASPPDRLFARWLTLRYSCMSVAHALTTPSCAQ